MVEKMKTAKISDDNREDTLRCVSVSPNIRSDEERKNDDNVLEPSRWTGDHKATRPPLNYGER